MHYKKIIRRFALAIITSTIAISGNAYARSVTEVLTQSQFLHRSANIPELFIESDAVRSIVQTDSTAMTIRRKVNLHARKTQSMKEKKGNTAITIAPYAVKGTPLTDTQKIRLITRHQKGANECSKLHTRARAECHNAKQMKKAFAFRAALVQK